MVYRALTYTELVRFLPRLEAVKELIRRAKGDGFSIYDDVALEKRISQAYQEGYEAGHKDVLDELDF